MITFPLGALPCSWQDRELCPKVGDGLVVFHTICRDVLLAFYDFPAEHWKHKGIAKLLNRDFEGA
jgi:hypothetical protein